MTTPEASLKRYIREEVQKTGGEYHALKNPSEKFWPDATILMPGGHVYFLEIKPDGYVKDGRGEQQKKRLIGLNRMGFNTFFVVGREEAKLTLIHMRERMVKKPQS